MKEKHWLVKDATDLNATYGRTAYNSNRIAVADQVRGALNSMVERDASKEEVVALLNAWDEANRILLGEGNE